LLANSTVGYCYVHVRLNITHRDFRLLLTRNLIGEATKGQDRPNTRLDGWPNACTKTILLLRKGSHYTVHVSLTVHKCTHIIQLITVNNVVYYISLQNTLFVWLHWSSYIFQSFITSYILFVKIFCNYYLQKRFYEQLIYIYI